MTRFDLNPDLSSSTQHTHVLRGNGDGSFESGVIFNTTNAFSIAVGDFSGDGRLDIAAVGDSVTFGPSPSRVMLSVLINNTLW